MITPTNGNSDLNSSLDSGNSINKSRLFNGNKKLNLQNKKVKLIIVLLIIFALIFSLLKIVKNRTSKQVSSNAKVLSSVKTLIVNKPFTFPALDNQGKKAGEIKLTITSAEKNPDVLVKDQVYKAKEGKLFLIVNLELQNDSTGRLNIFPGDLIRLIVGQEDKKYAPDLHNNVVMVAPISTKIDRIGFVINSDAKNLKLLVGELEKKKTEVPLIF